MLCNIYIGYSFHVTHGIIKHINDNKTYWYILPRAYLRGGGSGGLNPPTKKVFSDFFLKVKEKR